MSQRTTLYVIPEEHPSQRVLPAEKRDVSIATRLGARLERDGPRRTWTMSIGDEADAVNRAVAEVMFASQSAEGRYKELMIDWVGSAEVARDAALYKRFLRAQQERSEPHTDEKRKERRYYYTSYEQDSPYYVRDFDAKAKELGADVKIDWRVNAEGERMPEYGLRYTEGEIHPGLAKYTSSDAVEAFNRSRIESFSSYRALVVASEIIYQKETYRKASDDSSRNKNLRPLNLPNEPGEQKFGDYQQQVRVRRTAETAIRSMSNELLTSLVKFTEEQIHDFQRFRRQMLVEGNDISDRAQAYLTRMRNGLSFGKTVLKERGIDLDVTEQSEAAKKPILSQAHLQQMMRTGDVPAWLSSADLLGRIPQAFASEEKNGYLRYRIDGKPFYGYALSDMESALGDTIDTRVTIVRTNEEKGASRNVRVLHQWSTSAAAAKVLADKYLTDAYRLEAETQHSTKETNALRERAAAIENSIDPSSGKAWREHLTKPMSLKEAVDLVNEARKDLTDSIKSRYTKLSHLVQQRIEVRELGDTIVNGANKVVPKETIALHENTVGGAVEWRYVVNVDPDDPEAVRAGKGVRGFIVRETGTRNPDRFITLAQATGLTGYADAMSAIEKNDLSPDKVAVTNKLVLASQPKDTSLGEVPSAGASLVAARCSIPGPQKTSVVYGIAEIGQGTVRFKESHDLLGSLEDFSRIRTDYRREHGITDERSSASTERPSSLNDAASSRATSSEERSNSGSGKIEVPRAMLDKLGQENIGRLLQGAEYRNSDLAGARNGTFVLAAVDTNADGERVYCVKSTPDGPVTHRDPVRNGGAIFVDKEKINELEQALRAGNVTASASRKSNRPSLELD